MRFNAWHRAIGRVRCSEPCPLVIHGAEPKPAPRHPLAGFGSPVTVGTPALTHVSAGFCVHTTGSVCTLWGVAKTPKRRVPLRLDDGLAEWADRFAEASGSSRTAVYERALAALRADVGEVSASGGRLARPEGVPSAPRVVVEPSSAGIVDGVVPAAVPASRAERFRRATQG
jgi:hypothetical protein